MKYEIIDAPKKEKKVDDEKFEELFGDSEEKYVVRFKEKVQDFCLYWKEFEPFFMSDCELEEVLEMVKVGDHENLFQKISKQKYLNSTCHTDGSGNDFLNILSDKRRGYFPKVIRARNEQFEEMWMVATFLKVIKSRMKSANIFRNVMEKKVKCIFCIEKVSENPVGMDVSDGGWYEAPRYL